jgi:hypothetical protein
MEAQATADALATRTPTPTHTPEPPATPSVTPTLTPVTGTPSSTPDGSPTVTATQPLTLIRSFTISPAEIDPGDEVTLSWSATGEEIALYSLMPTGQLGTYYGRVPSQGTLTLRTASTVRNFVQYALYATQGGKTENATVLAAVRCPDTWFFASPPDACPQSPPFQSQAAVQHFEHGLMIWLGAVDRIYVLFADSGYPPVQIVADTWEPGMPESDPLLVPPPGYYQPVRGFGLVWRGEGPTAIPVRARVGWALELEYGYTSALQCDSAPKYNTCYLLGPGGEVIVLEPESSGWGIWGAP